MLQLVAQSETRGSANIPVRWCVGADTLARLQEKGALNPHLLLVVLHENKEVDRRLVPLSQAMEFLDFHRSGNHRVLGTIIWHSGGDSRHLRTRVFGGRVHRCSYSRMKVLDQEGNLHIDPCYLYADDLTTFKPMEETAMTVEVSAEHFAKSPSKFENWWVNLWFESRPRDECQFRKRRFLAYTVQPPVILVFLAVILPVRALAVMWLLLLAKRGVSLQPLIHPWRYETNDVWWDCKGKGTFFGRTRDGELREDLLPIFFPFTPIVGVVSFALLWLSDLVWEWGTFSRFLLIALAIQTTLTLFLVALGALAIAGDWLEREYRRREASIDRFFSRIGRGLSLLMKAFSFLAAVALLVLAGVLYPQPVIGAVSVVGTFWGFVWLIRRYRRKTGVEVQAQGKDEHERIRQQYESYRFLVCEGKPLKAEVRALPPERQTIYLRFKDLKAKICKSYALQ